MAARAKAFVVVTAQNICPGGIHLGEIEKLFERERNHTDSEEYVGDSRRPPCRFRIAAARSRINDQSSRNLRQLFEQVAPAIVYQGFSGDSRYPKQRKGNVDGAE